MQVKGGMNTQSLNSVRVAHTSEACVGDLLQWSKCWGSSSASKDPPYKLRLYGPPSKVFIRRTWLAMRVKEGKNVPPKRDVLLPDTRHSALIQGKTTARPNPIQ
jgi:hypothetical protein